MRDQKSAEGIVVGGEGGEPMRTRQRRPEQRIPRVGRMISMCVDEAEALATGAKDELGGRKPSEGARGAEACAATCGQTKSEGDALMERVVDRENMRQAYRRVLRNKGAAGVDGMSTTELGAWLKQYWVNSNKGT